MMLRVPRMEGLIAGHAFRPRAQCVVNRGGLDEIVRELSEGEFSELLTTTASRDLPSIPC
jgi:hypothetical protein